MQEKQIKTSLGPVIDGYFQGKHKNLRGLIHSENDRTLLPKPDKIMTVVEGLLTWAQIFEQDYLEAKIAQTRRQDRILTGVSKESSVYQIPSGVKQHKRVSKIG